MRSSDRADAWSINVPLADLLALERLPSRMDTLEAENKQLRRELESLRNIQSQTLQRLADHMRGEK